MRHIIILLAFLPFLTCSCRPETNECPECPVPPDTTSTGPFKVLWRIPLNPDTAECISMRPVVYNGNVLYSMLFYVDGYEYLRMVDAKTGAPVWSWDPIWPGETLWPTSRFAKDNIFVMTHWGPTYGIDMNTGANLWANDVSTFETSGTPNISGIGDFVYADHSARIILDTASYYVRANIHNGIWDTLFMLKIEDGYRPTLHPPSLWVSPVGDSILIFQNRQWNFPVSDGRIDLLAYNLKTRTFEWKVKDFDPEGNSNVIEPTVYNNKIYFQAARIVYCFDAATGNKLWSWHTPLLTDNLLSATLLVAENKLFVKPNNQYSLYGLDLNTGQTLVKIDDVGPGQGALSYYNGIIYYASGARLYAIRPSTKEVIWHDLSPNEKGPGPWAGRTYFDDVVVSPEHGCVFIGDRFFLMAIKLIE